MLVTARKAEEAYALLERCMDGRERKRKKVARHLSRLSRHLFDAAARGI